jgi:uncharacterized protein (TIGR02145 family)
MNKAIIILSVFLLIIVSHSCKKDATENEPTPIVPAETNTGVFTDSRDSKVYKWVKIGNQTWMQENLAYNANGSWFYNDDPSNGSIYGKLYSWQMACNSCPSGWRLPTVNDFNILINFLGGEDVAGGKMKSTGTSMWESPNTNATNSSKFTALPAGGRGYNGGYNSQGRSIAFWTFTSVNLNKATYFNLWYNTEDMLNYDYDKNSGFSVRCIKE